MRSIVNLIALAVIVIVLLAWALAPVLAFAGDGAPAPAGSIVGTVFAEVRPYIVEAISGLVLGAIVWALRLLQRWTGIQIEARHREALHSAAMTGVSMALDELGARADGLAEATRRLVIAEGVRYMKKAVPDALRAFGLDKAEGALTIEAIATAKLGQLAAGAR